MRVDEVLNIDYVARKQKIILESHAAGEKLLLELAPSEKAASTALVHEGKIANMVEKKGGFIWQGAAGSDAGWPDVGATIELSSGRTVHLHIEAKQNKADRMGSLRNWTFNGTKFSVPNKVGGNTAVLLQVMNTNNELKKNAKKLLKSLKKDFNKGVKEIRSGALSVITDGPERFKAVKKWIPKVKKEFPGKEGASNIQLAKIKDAGIGDLIINHYKKKFKAKGGGEDVLLFAVANEVFFIQRGNNPSRELKKEIAEFFGLKDIPVLPKGVAGSLEVRVQPRKVSGKDYKGPPSLDVQAVLRFQGLTKAKGAKWM